MGYRIIRLGELLITIPALDMLIFYATIEAAKINMGR